MKKETMDNIKEIKNRKLTGTVVSDRMDKTRVVAVERLTKHARYQKFFKITKRFKAHDEKNEFHTGDIVVMQETRPLSRDKRWEIVQIIQKGKEKNDESETEEQTNL